MDLKKLFGTNQRAEEAGVWVDMGQGGCLRATPSGRYGRAPAASVPPAPPPLSFIV